MTELDIRQWAKDNDVEVNDRGPVRKAVRDAFAKASGTDVADLPGDPGPPPAPGPVAPKERPPTRPNTGWLGKKTATPKPKTPRKRVSIESVVAAGWSIAAGALSRYQQALPLSRVLAMQAPVAGLIVEDLAKDTIVDKLLQPLARAGETGEKVAALIGPPLLVGAITARPEMYPVLAPMLKYSLQSWLELAGPAIKKAQERAEKLAEQIGPDVPAAIDAMIEMLFAPPPDMSAGPEPA